MERSPVDLENQNPEILIDQLRQRNLAEFHGRFLFCVPVDDGKQAIFFRKMYTDWNQRQNPQYSRLFGIHPSEGLLQLDGEAARFMHGQFEAILERRALDSGAEVALKQTFNDTLRRFDRSELSHVADINNTYGLIILDYSDQGTFASCVMKSMEIARGDLSHLAVRASAVKDLASIVTKTDPVPPSY